MKKKHIFMIIFTSLTFNTALHTFYPCDEDFIKALNIQDTNLCLECVDHEKAIEDKKGKNYIIDQFKSIDTSLTGHINYGMSLDDAQKKLEEIFGQMKKEGRITSKNEFQKVKDQYFIREGHVTHDLMRVWGANYLKDAISKDPELSQYDVPDYILVFDDPKNIEISIECPSSYNAPKVTYLYGDIYFKKISGKSVGNSSRTLNKIGYMDLSGRDGNDNVVDDGHKRYIIDTELGSFIGSPQFNNLKAKDFAGLKKDCTELYIKKMAYKEYGASEENFFTAPIIKLNLSSVTSPASSPLTDTSSIDALANALYSIS